MRGITPIVAVILLLLVTISITGFALIFFQRTTQQASEEVQSQLQQQLSVAGARFEIVGIDKNKVYVKNSGTANLQNLAFYVDGNQISNTSPFSITPNTVGEVLLNNSQLAMVPGDKLRVTSVGSAQEQPTKFYDKNTVAYWRFDDGERTAIKDYSGNGNDGTFVGEAWNDGDLKTACPNCPTITTGKYGNALSFDGVDDYIDLGTGFPDTIESAVTITAWVYRTGNTGGIFARSDGSDWKNERLVIYFRSDNNHWGWAFSDGVCQSCSKEWDISTFPANRWVHFALTWDGSRVKTYFDGVPFDSTPQTITPEVTNVKTRIGWTEGLAGQIFNGAIDEVRIYNRALTQQEIQEDMNSPYPVARTVASYSFEKIVSNQVYDTHNIVKGRYGAAMSFDGLNDFIKLPASAALKGSGPFTIETWAKTTVGSGYSGMFSNWWGSGWRGINLGINNGRIVLTIGNDIPAQSSITSNMLINDNTWRHLMGIYTGSEMKVYISGNFDNSVTPTIATIQYGANQCDSSLNKISIGANCQPEVQGGYFNGAIDEVRILNTAI